MSLIDLTRWYADYIDDYDAVDVLVKSKIHTSPIIDKNINRRAYFYKAMSTNLKRKLQYRRKTSDELDVDNLMGRSKTLKQFE